MKIIARNIKTKEQIRIWIQDYIGYGIPEYYRDILEALIENGNLEIKKGPIQQ